MRTVRLVHWQRLPYTAARNVERNQTMGKRISNLHEIGVVWPRVDRIDDRTNNKPTLRPRRHSPSPDPTANEASPNSISLCGGRLEFSLESSTQKWTSLYAPQVVLLPVIRDRGPPSERALSFIPESDHHHFRQPSLKRGTINIGHNHIVRETYGWRQVCFETGVTRPHGTRVESQ